MVILSRLHIIIISLSFLKGVFFISLFGFIKKNIGICPFNQAYLKDTYHRKMQSIFLEGK